MKPMMHEAMIEFMKGHLKENDIECSKLREKMPFRRRSEHILRVKNWAERLMEGESGIDRDSVIVASIFHDIGYGKGDGEGDHALIGARICRKYLMENDLFAEKIDFIASLVMNHSRKELLREKDSAKELIILMEADLLDETGALSIVWDCLKEGTKQDSGYVEAYEHIKGYSGRMLSHNPMVTEKGKRFWERKQETVRSFLRELEADLFFVKGPSDP